MGNIKSIQILTPLQEGLLFHALAKTDRQAYFEQYSFTMAGGMDVERFRNSLTTVMQRHDALRLRFIADKGVRPVQVIMDEVTPELTCHSLQHEDEVAAFLQADRERAFDILTDTLFRAAILHIGDNSRLVISFHHIILDGWSFAIVMNELIAVYHGKTILKDPVSFTGVTEYLARQQQDTVTQYWLDHLATESDFLPGTLTESFMQPSLNMEQVSLQTTFSEALSARLKQAAATLQVSINTILYGIWGILLSRYCRQKKVIAGLTVSGREIGIANASDVVGMCINTVPFPFMTDDDTPIDEYFSSISSRFINSLPYQYCAVPDIRRKAGVDGELFDHVVAVEDYPYDEARLAEGKIFGSEVFDRTNYPLSVHISAGKQLLWRISFNVDRYPQALIRQVLDHLVLIGEQVAQGIGKGQKLSDIKLWGDKQTNDLIHSFNNTEGYFPADKTLLSFYYELLEKHSPVRIEDEEHRLSIDDLEAYSNAVQHALAQAGVGRGDTVAICCKRSVWLEVAIMSILKRAGTYVPIDLRMPEDRIAFVLQDARVKIVLGWGEPLIQTEVPYIDMEAVIKAPVKDYSPVIMPLVTDPVYIIYTSGSTGMPKGVVVEHSAVVNRMYWMQQDFPLSKDDCILQKTSIGFDVSVWELFHWLFSGCTTFFLAPGKESEPYEIVRTIKDHRVTVTHFVPSMLALFMETVIHEKLVNDCAGLRFVFASGEALLYAAMQQFNEHIYRHTGTILVNLYGPTEATVDCTGITCSPWKEEYRYVPIGKPLLNTRAYILDEHQALLPPWISGELCIAGTGVARGYIGREQLTAEKFVADPFVENARMYKTGDLAMWNDEGDLIYLGRIDQQVKLNGQRIEPGDIEAKLLLVPGIREAVVLLMKREDGASFLYAFYTGEDVPAAVIRSTMTKLLPAYMIPSGFKRIEEIPRLNSGKINRKQLSALLKEQEEREPATRRWENDEIATRLLQVWAQVIGHEVDPERDFFANGAHSLTAVRTMSAIKRNFGVQISLPDILQHATLDKLSAYIKAASPSKAAAITSAAAPDTLPLMPSQESIYVLDSLPDIGFSYYVPALIKLEQKPEEQRLLFAIAKLLERYSVLRTRFIEKDEQVLQQILPVKEVYDAFIRSGSIRAIALPRLSPLQAFNDQRVVLDISQAPLFRIYLLQHNNTFYLLLDVHHLITDELSNTIFMADLMRLYKQEPVQPPVLQYHDVAMWYHSTYLKGELYQKDKTWWGQYLEKIPSMPSLPVAKDQDGSPFEGSVFRPVLPPAVVQRIRSLSSKLGVTDFTLIFSAFHIILSGYTDGNRLLCGLPFSNRMTDEMQDVTGFMVSTLPFYAQMDPATSFGEYVHATGIQLAQVMEHSWYPPAHILRDKQLSRYGSKHPLFNILFNYVVAAEGSSTREGLDPASESGARFDLSIEITEVDNTFTLSFIHATHLVDAALPVHLYNAFCTLLQSSPVLQDITIADLQLLTPPMGTGAVSYTPPAVVQVPADVEEKVGDIFKEMLKLKTVSPEDDFFLSGGQSLLAIKLVSRIREQFNIPISLFDVFKHPRLYDLSMYVASQQHRATYIIPHVGEQPFYSVSPLQRRLWFLQQREPDNISYNMTTAFKISTPLRRDILEAAFETLVQRHDQLRAAFILQENGPVVQLNELPEPSAYLTFLSGERSVDEIMDLAKVFSNTPFKLEQAPLFRVLIMENDSQHFYMVINLHHIIADGWSIGVLLSDLLSIYESKLAGTAPALAPLPLRYVDIAQWMSNQSQAVMESAAAYWLKKINAGIERSVFPYMIADDEVAGITLHHSLPEQLSQKVLQLARRRQVTDFQLLLFSFSLLQAKLSGTSHFVIGSSVSGRTNTSMEPVVGFFVNMMPVVVNMDRQATIRKAIEDFATGIRQDMNHMDISFDELSALVKKESSIQLSEYINTRFVYNDFGAQENKRNSIDAEEIEVVMEGSKFDLSFTVQPYKNTLSLNVEYKAGKYTKAVIISYVKQWEQLLEQLCDQEEVQVETLLTHHWDDTAVKLKTKSHELLKSMKK
ncbi:non-ribosomal peptide synthetase [Chitinophaga filiformis]|uniref:Amino acid adenylation domain-containing protein n=1 Tax=Chitinophaga filiformis TaxID=104663 RepID=A0A1G7M266_CHIFI|nr:non-ribosomal peptide synthetase [Chitinophaga filiformis]SDF55837.1 amino acid adenylation domain-containing protein [Chitinophaga filiformis]